CDPSNNCTTLTRTVHVVDQIAPFINIIGANPYFHPRFQQYVDPGVILTDNYYTDAQMHVSPYFIADISGVSNDKPGVYYVNYSLTDPSGNVADMVTRMVIVNEAATTGISNVNGTSAMKLYPNPNNGKFTIDAEGTEITSVKVYNIIGTLVKEISNKDNSKTIEIDMTGVSEGVYIVKMEGPGKVSTQKITIVK
ncbi:MAG: T9SS type A sorting domain-containing protein, partial [Bacteroidota bacterium]